MALLIQCQRTIKRRRPAAREHNLGNLCFYGLLKDIQRPFDIYLLLM
jgi:hypothetical protein